MYDIHNCDEFNAESILQENIALKKNVHILEVANKQLRTERDLYKQAYLRWSNNPITIFIKKILRR